MKTYLTKIDTATTGNRADVTPVFADAGCFAELVADNSRPFEDSQLDYVACVDALGFMLGTAIARRLGIGIIPVRKDGKLCYHVLHAHDRRTRAQAERQPIPRAGPRRRDDRGERPRPRRGTTRTRPAPPVGRLGRGRSRPSGE